MLKQISTFLVVLPFFFSSNGMNYRTSEQIRQTSASTFLELNGGDEGGSKSIRGNSSDTSSEDEEQISLAASGKRAIAKSADRFRRTEEPGYIPYDLPRQTKIVISCDGGGARGIILAQFFSTLHSEVFDIQDDRRWDYPLPVDLYAGTSVGALMAVAEAAGAMKDVFNNYNEIARRIFHKDALSRFLSLITFGLRDLYSPEGREQVIDEILEGRELNAQVLMTMYMLNRREVKVYDSNQDPQQLSLKDALMATSAAPTYFPPHIVSGDQGEKLTLIDGGVWQNNPSFIAYMYARKEYPRDVIYLISLGTGKSSTVDSYDDYPASKIGWGMRFPDIAILGSSQSAKLAMMVAKENDDLLRYFRLNAELDRNDLVTDNVNDDHLQRLKNATLKAIDDSPALFRFIVDILREVYRERY